MQSTPNTAPYFEEWRSSGGHLVEYIEGSGTKIFQVPNPKDDEGDEVSMTVKFHDMDFAEYNASSNEIQLELHEFVYAGDYYADVYISDGTLEEVY